MISFCIEIRGFDEFVRSVLGLFVEVIVFCRLR